MPEPVAMADGAEEVAVSAKAVGIIQPPPDMKNIVDKTATFVAKNGPQFEQRILTNERNTTKFAFLQPTSPYFPYYQKKLAEVRASLNSGQPAAAPAAPAAPAAKQDEKAAEGGEKKSATVVAQASVKKQQPKRVLKEPEADIFTVKPPEGLSIPSLDLDIIKLTAQYVALNGRSFLNGLLTRENRNPQFDFLKGHHYLFNFFTSLVEAYSKVINLPEKVQKQLEIDSEDRKDLLERAFGRLDWEAHVEKERQMKEESAERERESVAAIDWHDFVIVETIEFVDEEEEDLPPPLTEQQLRAMRLKASTAVEEAEEKTADGGGDMDMDQGEDMEMEEEEAEPEPPAEAPSDEPMKIVKNYQKPVPKPADAKNSTAYMVSPITGQQVPVEQMAEHMRIALLDPKWKEKSGLTKPGEKEDTMAQHDEVSANLAKLASKRKDIFGTDEEVFGQVGKKDDKKKEEGKVAKHPT